MQQHWLDRKFSRVAKVLDDGPMAKLGIRNTMRLATAYNKVIRGKLLRRRRELYRNEFDKLIQENGRVAGPVSHMKDGWALDTSCKLPYLPELLDEAEQVIRERGAQAKKDDPYRAFFRNIVTPEDVQRYPSFLNFITSSEVLTTACEYLGFIPCLSRTVPVGVRFTESWMGHDPSAKQPPRDSQLFHVDPYIRPSVYIVVLLRDVTPEQGPFIFFPSSTSDMLAKKIDYGARGRPYRLSDETIYAHVHERDQRVICYPKGTVLFVDSTRCFHYGSRNSAVPRYQMMYGLVSPVRSDFTESSMTPTTYACKESDSRLRKMVIDMNFRG